MKLFNQSHEIFAPARASQDSLADCSDLAHEAGIGHRVAITRAARDLWGAIRPKRPRDDARACLRDIVWALALATRAADDPSELSFQVKAGPATRLPLRAVSRPSGDGAREITVMLASEDCHVAAGAHLQRSPCRPFGGAF